MGLLLVWRHKLLCMYVYRLNTMQISLWRQTRIRPMPLLARSCERWWLDFVTFTACKRSIFGLKRGKKAQCVSNRCKDLVKRKKHFGIMGTLNSCVNFLFPKFILFLHFSFLCLTLYPFLLHYSNSSCNCHTPRLLYMSIPFSLYCKTPFISGCQFKILLYWFKLALLTSFQSKNSFELSTSKLG